MIRLISGIKNLKFHVGSLHQRKFVGDGEDTGLEISKQELIKIAE